MRKSKLLFLIFIISIISCRDTLDPIYKPEHLKVSDIPITLSSNISMTVLQPDAFHQFTQLIGWIPIIGGVVSKIMELPVDITLAVFPPLSSTSYPELPTGATWSDPKFLSMVSRISLSSGTLRITPKNERGPGYRPDMCADIPVPTECPDVEFDDFLKEIRVYLMFKDQPLEPEHLLAQAQVDNKHYNKKRKILKFDTTNLDLRPFMPKYDKFQIKVVATGSPPQRKVYMDGNLKISLVLRMSQ